MHYELGDFSIVIVLATPFIPKHWREVGNVQSGL
jgi:hypothetical protein